jgi:predicted RNA methylase
MDKMFTLLESLVQQLADLTAGTATFATGVGPTGPATNVADVQKLLTDLKLMAQ